MDEVEQRVSDCMASVFPDLDRPALRELSQESHAGWDSVAHVTLYAALGEAFAVELDFEAFAHATTFAGVLEQVRAQVGRSG